MKAFPGYCNLYANIIKIRKSCLQFPDEKWPAQGRRVFPENCDYLCLIKYTHVYEYESALLEPIGVVGVVALDGSLIFLGCSIMGGRVSCCSSIPYNFVPGGVYGMGIVLHNIFPVDSGRYVRLYVRRAADGSPRCMVFGGQFGDAHGAALPALYARFHEHADAAGLSRRRRRVESARSQAVAAGGDGSTCRTTCCSTSYASAPWSSVSGSGVGACASRRRQAARTSWRCMLQKFARHQVLDRHPARRFGFVVLSGLAGHRFRTWVAAPTAWRSRSGWMLTLYSLITIYITSRVIAYLLERRVVRQTAVHHQRTTTSELQALHHRRPRPQRHLYQGRKACTPTRCAT